MRVADTPYGWMQSLLLPWLEDPRRDTRQLLRWLQGLDLPPVDPNDEPYLWILRGLPAGGDLPQWQQRLAEAAAHVLDSAPDVEVAADDPEMLLFNLLELSARLRCEAVLSAPLRAMVGRDKLAGRQYLGMDLRHSLRFALTHNQPDCELEAAWMAMVRGQDTPGLAGSSRDGVEGILQMKVPRQPGAPPKRAIDEALTEYSLVLGDSPTSAAAFNAVLLKVRDRFPGHFGSLAFVEMSDRQKWLAWTDMAIPQLFMQTGEHRYVAWRPLYDFARQMNSVRVTREFCGGRVLEMLVGDPARERLLVRVGKVIEEFRDPGVGAEVATYKAWSAVKANQWRDWPAAAACAVGPLYLLSRESVAVSTL